MEFLSPTTWDEALAAKAEHPDARADRGRHRRHGRAQLRPPPPGRAAGPDPGRASSPTGRADGDRLRIGAGVTYTRIIDELGGRAARAWRMASRTVGSPQIRNRGTVGGNLGSASPAGDAHPPLLAAGAVVEVASVRGTRIVPVDEFFTGRQAQRAGARRADRARCTCRRAAGPQQFAKVGTRNAMVIAVCSFALALDPARRRVGTGIGSAAPTPLRATEAEEFAGRELPLGRPPDPLPGRAGAPVRRARGRGRGARSTTCAARAAYRRHALPCMARRTLTLGLERATGCA